MFVSHVGREASPGVEGERGRGEGERGRGEGESGGGKEGRGKGEGGRVETTNVLHG